MAANYSFIFSGLNTKLNQSLQTSKLFKAADKYLKSFSRYKRTCDIYTGTITYKNVWGMGQI